jgi:hypothetical protein
MRFIRGLDSSQYGEPRSTHVCLLEIKGSLQLLKVNAS